MYVILCSACGEQSDPVVLREHGEIASEGFAIGDDVGAVLGAEDAMDEHRGVRVGHGSTLIASRLINGDAEHTTPCGPCRDQENGGAPPTQDFVLG